LWLAEEAVEGILDVDDMPDPLCSPAFSFMVPFTDWILDVRLATNR
jgi:hypothetical protein